MTILVENLEDLFATDAIWQTKKTKKQDLFQCFSIRGYDLHLILSSINKEIIKRSDISEIPNNSKKYISFNYRKPMNKDLKLTY